VYDVKHAVNKNTKEIEMNRIYEKMLRQKNNLILVLIQGEEFDKVLRQCEIEMMDVIFINKHQ